MKFAGIMYSTKIIEIPSTINKKLLDASGMYNNSYQNDGYMVQNLYAASAVAMKMKEVVG